MGGAFLYTAFLNYLHPPSEPSAINGFSNFLIGLMGGILIYVAYDAYRRGNIPKPFKPDAIPPRTAMRIMLLFAAFMVFIAFWPLVWRPRLSFDLLFRLIAFAYILFEAYDAYRRGNQTEATHDKPGAESIQSETGIRIMAGIVIAFGVVGIGAGLWFAEFEWSRVTQWPRVTGVLVDKEFLPVGARLIFEYQVGGTRSAGRVYRYGGEDEMRTFLEPYRVGNN
jgi:hypothetical protein